MHQLTQKSKPASNAAEIVGYMPKRGDFEVEFDNDLELLLADLEFNEDDSTEERSMKLQLIDVYNERLGERIKRKEFVISRKLLDLKEQARLDRSRSKEEKEIFSMMKSFARYSTQEEHEGLVMGIVREKLIRQKLEDLYELRSKGYRAIAAGSEVEEHRRREGKSRPREEEKGVPIQTKRKIKR